MNIDTMPFPNGSSPESIKPPLRLDGGQKLRDARERLRLTLRDVEQASLRIAEQYDYRGFAISLSRLSDIEVKGVVPSVYRFYSLAVIYGLDIREILCWYGVPNLHESSGQGQQAAVTQLLRPATEVIPTTASLNRSQRRAGVRRPLPAVHTDLSR